MCIQKISGFILTKYFHFYSRYTLYNQRIAWFVFRGLNSHMKTPMFYWTTVAILNIYLFQKWFSSFTAHLEKKCIPFDSKVQSAGIMSKYVDQTKKNSINISFSGAGIFLLLLLLLNMHLIDSYNNYASEKVINLANVVTDATYFPWSFRCGAIYIYIYIYIYICTVHGPLLRRRAKVGYW